MLSYPSPCHCGGPSHRWPQLEETVKSLHVLGTQSAALKGTERKHWGASVLRVGVHLGISKAVPREAWGGGWVRDSMCVSFPRVPYLAVARTFEKIEEVSAR